MQPTHSEATTLDRKRGMFLGLAIGDALGAAVEFKSPGSFEPIVGYRDGGPHKLAPGEWTDDTSMALALADSIIHAGWDLEDQATRYLNWWQSGHYSVTGDCFDIGITTRQALSHFRANRQAAKAGPTGENASGNGSIMRLAPVPIFYGHLYQEQLGRLIELAVESSITTHGSTMCRSACAAFAVMLAALSLGESKETVTNSNWGVWNAFEVHHRLHPRVSEVIRGGSYLKKQPPEIRGSGFVVASLEAALWAFATSDSFEESVLKAVNLGEDSDTTGAVCGQLAGACWGESGIPESLLTGLAGRAILDPVLTGILRKSGSNLLDNPSLGQ